MRKQSGALGGHILVKCLDIVVDSYNIFVQAGKGFLEVRRGGSGINVRDTHQDPEVDRANVVTSSAKSYLVLLFLHGNEHACLRI